LRPFVSLLSPLFDFSHFALPNQFFCVNNKVTAQKEQAQGVKKRTFPGGRDYRVFCFDQRSEAFTAAWGGAIFATAQAKETELIDKVRVEFENCYGIDALSHEFDFTNNNMPVLIYAANGVMKTSFARTLRDYCEGREPQDIFFPERDSNFRITCQDGKPIEPDSIFVIDSLDEKYQSKKMSSLLASEELKIHYDRIFGTISELTEALFKPLKKRSGINRNTEQTFTQAFKVTSADLLVALGRLEREVRDGAHEEFAELNYKTLFSEKVLEFLEKGDLKELIEDYTKTYEKILNQSRYFRKGVFNHSNAETIAKNLKANRWFEGGHSVNLKHAGERNEITTQRELVQAIESEKRKILSDPQLTEMFEKVDSALKTAELRAFRDYLIDHPFVVPELNDIDAFKQKIWIAYLVKNRDRYLELIQEYDASKEHVKAIIVKAEKNRPSGRVCSRNSMTDSRCRLRCMLRTRAMPS